MKGNGFEDVVCDGKIRLISLGIVGIMVFGLNEGVGRILGWEI